MDSVNSEGSLEEEGLKGVLKDKIRRGNAKRRDCAREDPGGAGRKPRDKAPHSGLCRFAAGSEDQLRSPASSRGHDAVLKGSYMGVDRVGAMHPGDCRRKRWESETRVRSRWKGPGRQNQKAHTTSGCTHADARGARRPFVTSWHRRAGSWVLLPGNFG